MNRYAIAGQAVRAALEDQGVKTISAAIIGSAYIIDRTDGDVDVLTLIDRDPNEIGFGGWSYGGSVGEVGDQWGSWKRTVEGVEVNMLLTNDPAYYAAWCTAAEVCRLLHLKGIVIDRTTRVSIHSIVMDDSTAEDEKQRGLL